MDLSRTENVTGPFMGMAELPILRQVGLLVGLAASIALGVAIVLWAQNPNMSILYTGIQSKDISEITQILEREGIKYKADVEAGSVLVESAKIDKARLELASEGLPKGGSTGYEILQQEEGFGTSSFLQNARYHHAKEEELARTISTMSAVYNARVHLAIPKETAFLRDRKQASASVMLELSSGSSLTKRQVASIVHLVASSIDNLDAKDVTVVDSNGNLLSEQPDVGGVELSDSQFEYSRKVERHYIAKIENILRPIVGINKIRAQVVADIDFTRSEITKESFNPDPQAVRSEESFQEQSTGSTLNAGIPGALSNEPPGVGQAPETNNAQADATTGTNTASAPAPTKNQLRSTKNYELDRTITHTRSNPAYLKRLSVAVVIDDKVTVDAKGKETNVPYTPEELAKITQLVKEAIGFNSLRGDTVNIVNSKFIPVAKAEPLPEPAIWEQQWFWDVMKQVAAGLGVLFLVFGVLKPTLRGLAAYKNVAESEETDELEEDQLTLSETGEALPAPNSYESDLESAKSMASQEPKLVAQVVKNWVAVE